MDQFDRELFEGSKKTNEPPDLPSKMVSIFLCSTSDGEKHFIVINSLSFISMLFKAVKIYTMIVSFAMHYKILKFNEQKCLHAPYLPARNFKQR